MYMYVCTCRCIDVQKLYVIICVTYQRACVTVESLTRIEDDLIYNSPLSELAKKRRQEQQDVPVESGVFKIEPQLW